MSKDFIILEGKNLDELIEEGLKKLKKKKDEVDVEILEEGKSIIGFLKKAYKVKITPKGIQAEDDDTEIEDVLVQLEEVNNESSSFQVTYMSDGVYLTVYRCISSDEILTNRIVNRINRKSISDYDMNIIQQAIIEKNEEPVKIAPPQEEEKKNAEIVLDIVDKNMVAYMTLLPPLGGRELDFEEAMKIITEKVTSGIFYEEIKKALRNSMYNRKVLIARGKHSVDGKNGEISYTFETQKSEKKVKLMEDGSVDFRNLNLITNVKAGDILATVTLPTRGESGFTVTGEVLHPKPGNPANPKYGKNVILTEDGLSLIAESDGQVTFEAGKVTVREVYIVPANVDNSTGNIAFNGIVKIKGNVQTGFSVKAEGDIEVDGVVEAAFIESGSNIFLKRGMQGHNKGRLIAKGDIVAKYLENTYLFSDGCIKADAIMHSRIFSKDIIEINGKKGLLVGGVCKAKHEIHAKIVGSTMATVTELEVGVDPNIKAEYENIKLEIENTESNIDKLDKSITLLNRLAKNKQLNMEKKQLLIKCLNDRNTLINTLTDLRADLLDIDNQIEMLSRGKILVRDIIYPGVKITIGRSIMFVKKEIRHCTIYEREGEIKIGPFEM